MTRSIDPYATLTELSIGLQTRQFRSVDLVTTYLDRIRRLQPKLNAFVRVDEAGAMAAAAQSDQRREAGQTLGILDGLPIAIKDMFASAGEACGCGALAWSGRFADTDSSVVARLKQAGLCVLGRTQMVEMAFGAWGINPALGTPWNPWDSKVHRIPGGSSSGSAVAVAAGLAPAAIGSDTGGSVRAPAALNGVTGFKASHGRIDLKGALALSERLDSVGVLTRSADDAACLLSVLFDDGSDVSSALSAERGASDNRPLAGIEIVVLAEDSFAGPVDEEIVSAFRHAERLLTRAGATLRRQSWPFDIHQVIRDSGTLMAADGWRIHQAAMASTPGLPAGEAVRKRVMAGRDVDEQRYHQVLEFQKSIMQTWTNWLGSAQALLMPTVPIVAIPVDDVDESSLVMGLFNRLGNFVGGCSVSLPAGHSRAGLPMAVQLLAPQGRDALLVRLGAAFQNVSEFHRQRPDLSGLFL